MAKASGDNPDNKAFKNWFDRSAAKALAEQVGRVSKTFDQAAFVRRATKGLASLEFAGRVQQFSDALAEGLPSSIPRALAILTKSLPPLVVDTESVTDGWLQWPVGQFIADHGVPHFDESMEAMIALTQRFSSEFAVRPFVEQYPEQTFDRLNALTSHQSPHVRRWCSEGVRPRLPWGKKLRALAADPTPIWPILEALKGDPELYVRRSVANTLGDIAKDHPEQAVKRGQAWWNGGTEDQQWVVKHGLRALIKAGDAGALKAVGFGPPKKVSATLTIEPKSIAIGESVTLDVVLTSAATKGQEVMIDYVVHYVRKRDQSSGKVFKWTTAHLPARGTLELTKKHPMRVTTIRALYPGVHKVQVQVNGARVAEASFRLKP